MKSKGTLDERTEKLLFQLKEHLIFFSELGLDFIFASRNASPLSAGQGILSLEQEILHCQKCGLYQTRKQAVPGEGSIPAELMFVGEAPGFDEDTQGRPFVGRAGQLLTKIIQAMKFERSEVYITNVVKCRPPNNRVPHREEVECCTAYLLQQLKLIQPKVVVALGKVATDFFIPSSLGMTALRGNFYDFGTIQVIPTFHPSYLVRNESNREIRKMVWEDMQKVMTLLGKK